MLSSVYIGVQEKLDVLVSKQLAVKNIV